MLSAFGRGDGGVGRRVLATPEDRDVCEHLREDAARRRTGDDPDACAECLRDRGPHWVPCGCACAAATSRCCDSSPAGTPRRTSTSTTHPVMRSIELGEAWRWCYVDREAG